jgi:hypothetical protein
MEMNLDQRDKRSLEEFHQSFYKSSRVRAVQPAGQRISDGEDRRGDEVQRDRLPQQRAAIQHGEPEGEPGAGGAGDGVRGAAWRDTGADRAGVADGEEAVDRADSGTTKLSRLEENLGATKVELSPSDLAALEEESSKIKIEGARYPKFHESLVGR